MKLSQTEYPSYFNNYIALAHEGSSEGIIETLQLSLEQFFLILSNLPEDKLLYAYEEGKWTIKELVGHIIDTERILAYRALRIGRNDKVNLLSFDENDFVANSNANDIPFVELLKEFSLLRKSTIAMYQSFNDTMLKRIGLMSGSNVSTQALGYVLSGHVIHHLNILKERYL